ncbi:MAG: hypothetical protein JNN27_12060 [Planctomycetes bacterium]|nr:hypothetical protein [Planctomycetota bacterium]
MSTGRVVTGCSIAASLAFAAFLAVLVLTPTPDLQRLYLSAFGDTEYALGYSERVFDELPLGATYAEVTAALGPPLSEEPTEARVALLYASGPSDSFVRTGQVAELVSYTRFEFGDGERLSAVSGQLATVTGLASAEIELDVSGNGRNHLKVDGSERERLIAAQSRPADIEARYGPPTATYRNDAVRWLKYSRSPSGSDYEQRWIGLDRDGRVCFKRAEAYFD